MVNTKKRAPLNAPRRRPAELIVRDGKPTAVILDINVYEEMLEKIEEAEDLAELRRLKRQPQRYRDLEEVLKEHGRGV